MQLSPITKTPSSVGNSKERMSKKVWKNPVRDTGYAAALLGGTSVVAANRKKFKIHKYFACLAGVFVLAHIGIVEYYKYKGRQAKKQAQQ